MALKLTLPKESYWLDLVHGVRLFVKPLDTAVLQSARSRSARSLAKMLEVYVEQKAAGIEKPDALPDPDDEDGKAGLTQLLFAQTLANAAIDGKWEGVLDQEDQPAEVNTDTVNDLMRIHSVSDDFLEKYCATHAEVIAEKNGSAAAASGTSQAAESSAETAKSSETRAPGEDEDQTASSAPT